MLKKTRGEVITVVAVAGLLLVGLMSTATLSFFRTQRQSYKSLAYESDGSTPTRAPTKPASQPTSSTSNCPSTGFFSTSTGCAQQCGGSVANCKTCQHVGIKKWYCNGTGGGGLSSLPKCTTPNSFSGCPTECNGQCEACNANGTQKNHCKLNSGTAGLNTCVAASYALKASCDPHCGTQCSACKIGTTVKYECNSTYNQNIPKCGNGVTYSSQASCKAPSACGANGKCTLCEQTPGNNRYECNGAGPTLPLTQAPVGVGDCHVQSTVIAGGLLGNGKSTCSGSYLYSCNDTQVSSINCPLGCANGKCNAAPTAVPTAKPDEGNPDNIDGTGQCVYTGPGGCSVQNRYPASNCNPPCMSPLSCCGAFVQSTDKVCDALKRQCVQGILQICKSDGSGWIQESCASGYCLNSTTCAVVGNTTPTSVIRTTISLAPTYSVQSGCQRDADCQMYNPNLVCVKTAANQPGKCEAKPAATPSPTVVAGNREESLCRRSCVGTCVKDPTGFFKCVPYSTPVPGNDVGTNIKTECGGLNQSCCEGQSSDEWGVGTTVLNGCNQNLKCVAELCIVDEAFEKNNALLNTLDTYLNNQNLQNPNCTWNSSCSLIGKANSNACGNSCVEGQICCGPLDSTATTETIGNYIQENTANNPLAEEQLKDSLSNSCKNDFGDPCDGTCVFSDTLRKFTCVSGTQITKQFDDVKEENAKNIGDKCVPLIASCRSELLECVAFKCQIKKESQQFLGYGAAAQTPTNTTGSVGKGGGLGSPTQTQNLVSNTAGVLGTLGTAQTQEHAANNDYAKNGCNTAGSYFLSSGQCYACIDPDNDSIAKVTAEYCSNESLQNSAVFGFKCKAGGNYCAANTSQCTSSGQSDCPSTMTCCSASSGTAYKSQTVGGACQTKTGPNPDGITGPSNNCKPGLECYDNVCRDAISIAYDDKINSGTGSLSGIHNIPVLGGITTAVVDPLVRSFNPDYYNTAQTRADVTQSNINSCGTTLGEGEQTCNDLFGQVDQLAQADMTQNTLAQLDANQAANGQSESVGEWFSEGAYNAVVDITKFASAYSGTEKTVSGLTYAEQSAQTLTNSNGDISTIGAYAVNVVTNIGGYGKAAIQPAIEVGMTVADVGTLGLGDSIFTMAGKAAKNAAESLTKGAITTGVRELAQEGIQATTKKAVQETVEQVARTTAEEALQKFGQETAQETAKQTFEELGTAAIKKSTTEVLQKSAQESTQKTLEEILPRATAEIAQKLTPETGQDVAQAIVKETQTKALEQIEAVIKHTVPDSAAQKEALEAAREAIVEATTTTAKAVTEPGLTKTATEVAEEISQKILAETPAKIEAKITQESVTKSADKIAEGLNKEFTEALTKEATPENAQTALEETLGKIAGEVTGVIENTAPKEGGQKLAAALNIVSNILNTEAAAKRIMEAPVIGPILTDTEKLIGRVMAAPILLGVKVGNTGPGFITAVARVFTKGTTGMTGSVITSPLEKKLSKEISERFGKLLEETVENKSSDELFQKLEKEMVTKYGSSAPIEEIQKMVQRQAEAVLQPTPLSSNLDLGAVWKELETQAKNGIEAETAIITVANSQAKNLGEDVYSLIPQIKTIAQARELANTIGVDVSKIGQIDNFVRTYSDLISRQAVGGKYTPRELVTALTDGGMSFGTANKITAKIMDTDSPLLMTTKAARNLAQNNLIEAKAEYDHLVTNSNTDSTTNLVELQNAREKLAKALNDYPGSKTDEMKKLLIENENLKLKEQALAVAKSDKELAQAEVDLLKRQTEDLKIDLEIAQLLEDQKKISSFTTADGGTIQKYGEDRISAIVENQRRIDELLRGKNPNSVDQASEIEKQLATKQRQLNAAEKKLTEATNTFAKAENDLRLAQKSFANNVGQFNPTNSLLTRVQNGWNGLFSQTEKVPAIESVISDQKRELGKTKIEVKKNAAGVPEVFGDREFTVRRNGQSVVVPAGKKAELQAGDEIYLSNKHLMAEGDESFEWLKVNKSGQLDEYHISVDPKGNSQKIVSDASGVRLGSGSPGVIPSQIGEVKTFTLKVNEEPPINFHVAENIEHTTPENFVQQMATTVQGTREFLGPKVANKNLPVDVLVVSEAACPRAFASGDGLIVTGVTKNSSINAGTLAHELTHQLTGISPLLSLTEGIAVYGGAMVTGDTLNSSLLTRDNRHYADLASLVDKSGGSSLSETKLLREAETNNPLTAEAVDEYTYAVGTQYIQAIDQTQSGIDSLIDIYNRSMDLFEHNYSNNTIRVKEAIEYQGVSYRPGDTISNSNAINYLLEQQYGPAGHQAIIETAENNIANAAKLNSIKPKIDSSVKTITVGRGANNNWQLQAKSVSREQLTISQDLDGTINLFDHSLNGTFVSRNGVVLPKQPNIVLEPNDVLILYGEKPPLQFAVRNPATGVELEPMFSPDLYTFHETPTIEIAPDEIVGDLPGLAGSSTTPPDANLVDDLVPQSGGVNADLNKYGDFKFENNQLTLTPNDAEVTIDRNGMSMVYTAEVDPVAVNKAIDERVRTGTLFPREDPNIRPIPREILIQPGDKVTIRTQGKEIVLDVTDDMYEAGKLIGNNPEAFDNYLTKANSLAKDFEPKVNRPKSIYDLKGLQKDLGFTLDPRNRSISNVKGGATITITNKEGRTSILANYDPYFLDPDDIITIKSTKAEITFTYTKQIIEMTNPRKASFDFESMIYEQIRRENRNVIDNLIFQKLGYGPDETKDLVPAILDDLMGHTADSPVSEVIPPASSANKNLRQLSDDYGFTVVHVDGQNGLDFEIRPDGTQSITIRRPTGDVVIDQPGASIIAQPGDIVVIRNPAQGNDIVVTVTQDMINAGNTNPHWATEIVAGPESNLQFHANTTTVEPGLSWLEDLNPPSSVANSDLGWLDNLGSHSNPEIRPAEALEEIIPEPRPADPGPVLNDLVPLAPVELTLNDLHDELALVFDVRESGGRRSLTIKTTNGSNWNTNIVPTSSSNRGFTQDLRINPNETYSLRPNEKIRITTPTGREYTITYTTELERALNESPDWEKVLMDYLETNNSGLINDIQARIAQEAESLAQKAAEAEARTAEETIAHAAQEITQVSETADFTQTLGISTKRNKNGNLEITNLTGTSTRVIDSRGVITYHSGKFERPYVLQSGEKLEIWTSDSKKFTITNNETLTAALKRPADYSEALVENIMENNPEINQLVRNRINGGINLGTEKMVAGTSLDALTKTWPDFNLMALGDSQALDYLLHDPDYLKALADKSNPNSLLFDPQAIRLHQALTARKEMLETNKSLWQKIRERLNPPKAYTDRSLIDKTSRLYEILDPDQHGFYNYATSDWRPIDSIFYIIDTRTTTWGAVKKMIPVDDSIKNDLPALEAISSSLRGGDNYSIQQYSSVVRQLIDLQIEKLTK